MKKKKVLLSEHTKHELSENWWNCFIIASVITFAGFIIQSFGILFLRGWNKSNWFLLLLPFFLWITVSSLAWILCWVFQGKQWKEKRQEIFCSKAS